MALRLLSPPPGCSSTDPDLLPDAVCFIWATPGDIIITVQSGPSILKDARHSFVALNQPPSPHVHELSHHACCWYYFPFYFTMQYVCAHSYVTTYLLMLVAGGGGVWGCLGRVLFLLRSLSFALQMTVRVTKRKSKKKKHCKRTASIRAQLVFNLLIFL